MQKEAFIGWLVCHGNQPNSAASRASGCKRVESHYSDLDALSPNGFLRLLEEFDPNACAGKHKIPISGNYYNGTAALKSSLELYRKFRFDQEPNPASPTSEPAPEPPMPVHAYWPEWESPSEEDSLHLAQVLTRHTQFLHPDIVRRVVEDNERHAARWGARLVELGVATDAYLWPRSPCAFPGVRRYTGSAEIAKFRGHKPGDGSPPPGAVAIDDNDYPKHLWSFLFRGKPFQKHGPKGYNLAHVVDHKDHGNRAAEHFELAQGASVEGRLYGLFTCPTNTVFVPLGLLKPTDFHPKVRGLLIRKAQALYGSCCSIVPPFMSLRECGDSRWSIDRFEWAEPVGDPAHLDKFLAFRNERLDKLLAQAGPTPAS
ncbi:MAG: hypothetical protein JSR84_02410 [Proteobacteria bacterium]|nr:hypothetical protein [Pseudomonadota bacterium]